MKLLTHNMLTSKCMKSVKVGYPLGIIASDVKEQEVDFNRDFIARVIPKLEWSALRQAAENVGQDLESVPVELPENFSEDEEFLKKAHHLLMEVEILEGDLVCPETGRKFPIKNGIPNMLLTEDEVGVIN